MLVFVTGGTGFVGSHSVAALLRKGHQVRLLVRSPERVALALEPLGVPDVDYVVGDVTAEGTVEEAMRGCQAAIHAAGVYFFDTPLRRLRVGRMRETNIDGTTAVLGAAQRLGLDPIVHVSTFAALLPTEGRVLTPDSPSGSPRSAYSRSKADADRAARRFQDEGAPVVISYPGMVWGPHDPHLGESSTLARLFIRGRVPLTPHGGVPVTDVRDVAAAHAALLEPGRGPRRYLLGGTHLPFEDVVAGLARAAGHSIRHHALSPGLTRLLGRVHEAFYLTEQNARCDDSRAREELGFEARDPQESFTDTVRWLAAQGQL
ncbi:MAG: NAD-dependent epimerase/dehydratase family protein [Gaiellaceae bacterium]